tara:strand:+ start:691 stop:1536 length:846 start_codon:yes stop_codon:yes gene_type:complete
MPYGVTNSKGKVPLNTVKKILEKAIGLGIQYIDTAQSYGDSETALGKSLPMGHDFKITSKFSTLVSTSSNHEVVKEWEKKLHLSLEKLGVSKLHSLLLHNSLELNQVDSKILFNWLRSIRERGLVDYIGASIYVESDLDFLPLNEIQIVQLPLSIYDQRHLQNGTIKKLNELGISVHVRSVYLQGLILQKSKQLPYFLSAPFKKHHFRFCEELSKVGINQIDAALNFIKDLDGIESAVIGVSSLGEFKQLVNSWNQPKNFLLHGNWAWENHNDLDPRLWGR